MLPGKLKRLGGRSSFMTPRRPVKTTGIDCRIRGGEYVAYDRANYATALGVWLPAARAGDPEAQTYVGEIFEKGLAGTSDPQAAAEWYRKAADQGFTRAQINLGHLYERGHGVPQDSEQALQWYRRATGLTEAVVLDYREEAASLRQQVTAAEIQLRQARAELEASRQEMAEMHRRLKARPGAEDTVQLTSELENREQEIDQRSRSIEELQSIVNRYSTQLAEIESGQGSQAVAAAPSDGGIAAPSIEIVRPDILTTRGPALMPIPVGTLEMEIVGRVTSAAGLRKLTIDEQAQTPDSRGFFRVKVPCAEQTEVRIAATDLRGRATAVSLILMPQSDRQPSPPTAMGDPIAALPPDFESGRYQALIISIADYTSLPVLKTARRDAEEVERLLAARYGFETTMLSDPTYFEILTKLDTLRKSLGPGDNLLVYYAGHGALDEKHQGYWLPADANLQEKEKWIPNDLISDYLSTIPARHILVVSDSCYSGTLTRSSLARLDGSLPPEEQEERILAIASGRSRTVLTSGGLQPVLDEGGGEHSLFANAFISVLSVNDGVLPGTRLHQAVSARVSFAASALGLEQSPNYAPVHYAGHEAGDFLFLPGSLKPAAAGAGP